MEFYSAAKKIKFPGKWIKLEILIASSVMQAQKDNSYVSSLKHWL